MSKNSPKISALEFRSIIRDMAKNEMVKKMKIYRQHYDTSCYEHCFEVAWYNYVLCKKLKLDYVSAVRAGMVHDLFLYDWRKPQPGRKRLHAFHHPRIALDNALKVFDLNKKEQDIILKHMWPLTVVPPKYAESYIITLTDKHCTLKESIKHYRFAFFGKSKKNSQNIKKEKIKEKEMELEI